MRVNKLPIIHHREESDFGAYRRETLDLEFSNGERRKYERLKSRGHGAVIIVSSNSVLRERTGVELIPLMDGRALIAFGDELCPLELELRIRDGLADPSLEGLDRRLRPYIDAHPFVAVGLAAAAGFLLGRLLSRL